MSWELKAQKAGVELYAFTTVQDLQSHLGEFGVEDVFYIDYYLKNDETSHALLVELKQKGFKNVYLTSGLDLDELKVDESLVKGQVDKKPQFD